MQEMTPFYAQVLGIGLIWITVHCIGMCGPIMASLTAGMGVHRAPTPGRRTRKAAAAVLSYQGGRGLVYAGLGASAGLAGAAAQTVIEDVARTAGLGIAVVIFGVGVWKCLPLRQATVGDDVGWSARWTSWALKKASRMLPKSGVSRMAAFGVVLGFLPCVLMFWVLGIAASTASPLHGALIMVMLVAMTTPVLLFAALGSSLPGFFKKIRSERVIGGAMLVSGSWLGLIAAAANGWIEHVHIPFEIWGRELVVMLW